MSRLAYVCGLSALLAAGCAQLAGIDNTTGGGGGGGDGGGVDGPVSGSSITFQRYSIGSTVIAAPQSVAGLPVATFNTAGGPVVGVTTSDGWTTDQTMTSVQFDLPGAPAGVAQSPQLWELGPPNIKAYVSALERPGAAQPPAGATVAVNLTLDTPVAATDAFELDVVGAWSAVGIAPGTVGATSVALAATPYTQFTSLNGRGTLDSIGATDAVLGLRYNGNQLIGVADLPGFAQTAADTVSGAITALPLTQNLNANVQTPTAVTRLGAAVPASPNAATTGWSLNAAPGYLLSSNAGVQLTGGASALTDTTVTSTYTNPFLAPHGWHSVFTWVIETNRTYTPAAGSLANQTINLLAELATLREPGDGTTPDNASLDAGMPTNITLGATPLTTDGIVLADDPTTPLTVTFAADVATNTMYQAQVVETTLVNGTEQNGSVLTYLGTSPTFTLPANTLVAGHTYRIRAACRVGGYPDLATGDLTNATLPISVGVLDSGVFSVGTPQ